MILVRRFVVATFFLLVVSGLPACEARRGPEEKRPGALAEAAAPDFTLKNLADEDVNLNALLKANKAVLLNFWASWCPPCREEIPDLIQLQDKTKGSSFTVVGVNVGESRARVTAFARDVGINYPVVLDEDTRVASSYGVLGIPTTFLIGSDGKVISEYHGYTPHLEGDVEKAIQ